SLAALAVASSPHAEHTTETLASETLRSPVGSRRRAGSLAGLLAAHGPVPSWMMLRGATTAPASPATVPRARVASIAVGRILRRSIMVNLRLVRGARWRRRRASGADVFAEVDQDFLQGERLREAALQVRPLGIGAHAAVVVEVPVEAVVGAGGDVYRPGVGDLRVIRRAHVER